MAFNPDQYIAEKAGASAPASAASATGFNPDAYIADKSGGSSAPDSTPVQDALRNVGSGVAAVGGFVDRFTGAPVRSAIGAIQNNENPVSAYLSQFGEDPENAPTGKEIARKIGVGETSASDIAPGLYSKDAGGFVHDLGQLALAAGGVKTPQLTKGGIFDPTASGAVGLGIDVAADPLNLLGAGEALDAAKAAGRTAGTVVAKGGEAAARAANLATGTELGTKIAEAGKSASNAVSKVFESSKHSIGEMLNPRVSSDVNEMRAVADSNGIPRELMSPAHEYGETSAINSIQKHIAEGPKGQKYLDAHNNGMLATSDALEKRIATDFATPPATDADAGQALKDSIDKHVSDTFDNAELTYQSAGNKFPGMKLDDEGLAALQSKAIGMKNEAIRLERTSRAATQLSQAKNLREWSDLILDKAANGGSYKELADIVQNVGRAAFEKVPVGQIPADVKKLRELYNVGSESLIQTVRNHSAAAADELVMNNMEISKLHGDQSLLGNVVRNANNPEQVYNALISRGGSKQILALKEMVPEGVFNQMRAKYLQGNLKYFADGSTVNFDATAKALQKNKDRLAYLFNPKELRNTTDLLDFGRKYGSPVASKSGTGMSLSFSELPNAAMQAVKSEGTLDFLKARAQKLASGNSASPAASPAASGRGLLRDRGAIGNRAKLSQSIAPQFYERPSVPKTGVGEAPNDEAPAKGPAKWANDGLENLKEHAGDDFKWLDDVKDRVLADPKGKQLLVAASDFKPGSKGLDNILERIKRTYGPAASKP